MCNWAHPILKTLGSLHYAHIKDKSSPAVCLIATRPLKSKWQPFTQTIIMQRKRQITWWCFCNWTKTEPGHLQHYCQMPDMEYVLKNLIQMQVRTETTLWPRYWLTPGQTLPWTLSQIPVFFSEMFLLPEGFSTGFFQWLHIHMGPDLLFIFSIWLLIFSESCLFSLVNCHNHYFSHNSPWTHLRPCPKPSPALQVGFAFVLIQHKSSFFH